MPAPFSKSPLFRNAPATLQRAARSRFQKSIVGKMQGEIEKLGRLASGNDVRKVVEGYVRKMQPGKLLPEILGRDTRRMAAEVQRYARGQGLSGKMLGQVLSALGPAGRFIRALIEPEKSSSELLSRELQTATDFLRSFGRLVIEPNQTDQAEQIAEYLRQQGFVVLPPGQQRPARTKSKPAKKLGDLSKGVATVGQPQTKTVQIGTSRRRFPVDHPIVTGEMVIAPNSTNVHSFGYDIDSFYLYVRFLGITGRVRSGAGALYRYAGVTPQEYLSLYRVRNGGDGVGGSSTPGTWMWTHLRVRGTISGHRKDYELVGIVGGYVPRKATLLPEGEAYIRRTVRTLEGKAVRSALGDKLVRPLAPVKVGRPRMAAR
jgi:hypothetical protein